MLRMIVLMFVLLQCSVYAASVAIIDSGTDMKHESISPVAWINPVDNTLNDRDEDRNGYQDDIYGWNFAESNNQVIDYKYLGTLNNDIRKFFDIQAKMILGSASSEEVAWMKEIRKNEEFMKRLSVYGNFMHGTHVAGIAAHASDNISSIMAVKLIPTEVKLPGGGRKSLENTENDLLIKVVKGLLTKLAQRQMKSMEEIFAYIAEHKIEIANGSFGTGYNQAKRVITVLFQSVLRRRPTEEEVKVLATHFINEMIKSGKSAIAQASKTLFVFAAGNDASNNDKFPTSPTNIKADNTISVAATIDAHALAPFSNFGKKMVDVAAPGVGIKCAVPGNEYLKVSGTSQAAPYVASVASGIKDINKSLTPKQIKKIIIGTVDFREFLKNKVKSNGLVNSKRAIRAATLSLSMTIDDAVSQARVDIDDRKGEKRFAPHAQEGAFVLPLTPQFYLK